MRISDWSSDVCSSDLTVSRALRHKRAILARNTLPMPDYFHVETRTCGVFLSAGRTLAKRRGKTRPVLHPIPVGAASAGGLDLSGPVPGTRDWQIGNALCRERW